MTRVYKVQPQIKHYDWGKGQAESLVYALYKSGTDTTDTAHSDDKNTPYAELWLGTHKNGPCTAISIDGYTHNSGSWVQYKSETQKIQTPQINGACMQFSCVIEELNVRFSYPKNLPWPILFKVLSIGKPLSIQIHPDEEMSARLLARGHDTIVDANGKAEMCVAVCDFKAMAGFRPTREILDFAGRFPKFAAIIGGNDSGAEAIDVPTVFLRLLQDVDNGRRKELVYEILEQERGSIHAQFIEEITRHFDTRDPCVLLPLILQCLELRPGEALYIAPNTIHAYISGDCLELMNNSDNVIRCGLTKKQCDVETCIDIVKSSCLQGQHLKGIYLNPVLRDETMLYVPDDDRANFQLASMQLGSNKTVEFNTWNTVPLLLFVLGCAGNCTLEVVSNDDHQVDSNTEAVYTLGVATSLFVPSHANLKVSSGKDSNLSLCIAAPKHYGC